MSGYKFSKPKNSAAYNAKVLATHAKRKGHAASEDASNVHVPVTQQVIDNLCLQMAEFGEPMEVACTRANITNCGVLKRYLKAHPEAAEQVEEARVRGVHTIAYDLRKVAKGEAGFSSKDVNRDKLIIDTDFRILKAIAPREYGDKQHVEVEGKMSLEQLVLMSMKAEVVQSE